MSRGTAKMKVSLWLLSKLLKPPRNRIPISSTFLGTDQMAAERAALQVLQGTSRKLLGCQSSPSLEKHSTGFVSKPMPPVWSV